MAAMFSIPAKPYAFEFPAASTALLLIDMQRDFLLEGGFGDIQGGVLTDVQASIKPCQTLLQAWRACSLPVIHTREGHKADMTDVPSTKLIRQNGSPNNTQHSKVIGDSAKMGRILIQGEYGHDFVDELQPMLGEIVIDKPGKGAFYNTRLMEILKNNGITHLIMGGVTTECCVTGTLKEANDRGFETCVITQATAGYNLAYKTSSLDMVYWSEGLFGFVAEIQPLLEELGSRTASFPSSKSDISNSSSELTIINAEGTESNTAPSSPTSWDESLRIPDLIRSYKAGISPITVIEALYTKIEAYAKKDPAVWIHLVSRETALAAANDLTNKYSDRSNIPPLFGVPFSVKDSIDVAGLPTTTACPPLAFIPSKSAVVYDKFIAHGAIFLGKTNLDQLATGLSGARSPYGIPRSVFNKDYISGGSSSGNAVSVGAGLVSFSLATDTAGSGRVPALFNGVVGFKPTKGCVSFQGVTPACLSLDCCSFMASNVADARKVWSLVEGFDPEDRYAKATPPILRSVNATGGPLAKKFRFGIPPPEALNVCSPTFRAMFNDSIKTLQEIGGQLVPVDWTTFVQAGKLLYDGTFVSERLASLPDDFMEKNKDVLHPVIRDIFEAVIARNSSATDVFRDLHKQALYVRQAQEIFSPSGVTTVVVPTAPTHFTVEEVLADPIRLNTILGTYTHFGNVLDLLGVAVPGGTYPAPQKEEGSDGVLPFGITFLGGSRTEPEVLDVAARFEEAVNRQAGAATRK